MASANIKMLGKTGNNTKSDECYTPREAILPLMEFLDKSKTYYDCTSGISSQLVDTMNSSGYKCLPSGNIDFLKDDEMPKCDVIITNPPFSKKDKFIEECYKTGKPFALLLPVSSLQGQKRGEMFNKHGVEILALNKRIDFTGKGSPHFGVAWFCHKILPEKLMFR